MPKPVDPDEFAEMQELAARLKPLTEHPGWAELRKVMEQRRDHHEKHLGKRALQGSVTQEEITRHAGYWKGAFDVLEQPAQVGRKLDTALRRAQQTEGVDE